MKTKIRKSIFLIGILSIILVSFSNITSIKGFEIFLGYYSGYVKDTNNQPVNGAIVEIYVNGVRKASDYTDSNGFYYIHAEYPTGTRVLKVKKDGYQSTSRTISGVYNNFQIKGLWGLIIDGHDISGGVNEEERFTRDSLGMYNILINNCGFTASRTYLVSDATEIDNNNVPRDYASSKNNIILAFDQIAERVCNGDQVVIFIVGHGLEDRIFSNTDLEFSASDFDDEINKINCGQIIIYIGNCHSGSLKDDLEGSNRAIFMSCEADDIGLLVLPVRNGEQSTNSLFPLSVYQGLEGYADSDNNNRISLSELFIYCDSFVNDYLSSNNMNPDDQNPVKSIGTSINENYTYIGNA